MFFDPLYLVVTAVGLALVFLPQMWLKNVFGKYAQIRASRNYTGAQVAETILRHQGINDVRVESTPGELSDHYDPISKRVRLSEDNYHGNSIAAVAVAAHEVGHAIQHAQGYKPVEWRSALVPVVNLGSNLGPILIMISLGLGFVSHTVPEWALMMAWAGLGLFSLSLLFHVLTLPVEFDASRRALAVLSNGSFLDINEVSGAKKVLTAAAMTYVSVALYSLIQVLYYAYRIFAAGRRG